MKMTVMDISARVDALEALNAAVTRAADELIESIAEVDAGDREAGVEVLRVAKAVGRAGQAREGQLVQVLAHAHRIRANRGGLVPWVTVNLDVTAGRARAIADAARRIGGERELAKRLSSGSIGGGTIRALARTARAVEGSGLDKTEALTETLDLSSREGVGAANRRVRVLEEKVRPGCAGALLGRQRERSFARIVEVDGGMVRMDVLLDPVRATTLRCAVDLFTAAMIRARQYDGSDLLPTDVRTTDQLQVQALVRFAELFLSADPEQRGASFTAPVLYHAPLHTEDDGAELAESVYGDLVPLSGLAPLGNPAAHLVEHVEGQPVLLDGKLIDTDPDARLASPGQRTALAFRDRTCTEPGCTRPVTWSLHAHHVTAYARGGRTTMRNLALLCSEHHSLTHHPGH